MRAEDLLLSPQLFPWSPCLWTPCSPPSLKALLAFQSLSWHYRFCPILLSFLSSISFLHSSNFVLNFCASVERRETPSEPEQRRGQAQ